MIFQSIISQTNYIKYNEQPSLVWNGSLSGDYTLVDNLSIKNIFTPVTTNVDTYNHHIQIAKYYNQIHIIFSTHESAEIGYGSRVRYSKSTDDGETWSEPVVLLEAQDDSSKDYTVIDGRQSIASDFAIYDNELYAIVDVNKLYASELLTAPREGVGILAIKINSNSTFGTPVWIDTPSGLFVAPEPLPTFPSYSFDSNLRFNLRKWLNDGVNNPISYFSVPDTDNLFTRLDYLGNTISEPSCTKLPNGLYIRLWKDGLFSGTDYKIAQTSINGVNWNDPYTTGIPDVNSRTRIHKLKNNEVCLIGNNHGGDRDPLYFAISKDGFTYNSDDIYQIDKSTYSMLFSGQGKSRGAQHPTKIIELDNNRILIGYNINKEEVKVAIFDKPEISY